MTRGEKMKNKDFENNASIQEESISKSNESLSPKKKIRFSTLRAATMAVLVFTLICGIIYPVSAVILAKTIFPYEADGSVIRVTMADGSERVFGSEVMGVEFNQPYYLLGRVNNGAPTNFSPESANHADNMAARREYLYKLGYIKKGMPQNLVTSSGSGVDPHIMPEDAEWQVEYLAKHRFDYGWRLVIDENGDITDYIRLQTTDADADGAIKGKLVSVAVLDEPIVSETAAGTTKTYCAAPETKILWFAPAQLDKGTVLYDYDAAKYEGYVRSIIKKYTEGRWLWIFGEKTVNVLLVNLALDGLL